MTASLRLVGNDGSVTLIRYDWANNTPYYPAYRFKHMLSGFIAAHGGDRASPALIETTWMRDPAGASSEAVKQYNVQEGIAGITTHIDRKHLEKLAFIVIFSEISAITVCGRRCEKG